MAMVYRFLATIATQNNSKASMKITFAFGRRLATHHLKQADKYFCKSMREIKVFLNFRNTSVSNSFLNLICGVKQNIILFLNFFQILSFNYDNKRINQMKVLSDDRTYVYIYIWRLFWMDAVE